MSTWHDESDIGNRHIVEKRCQKKSRKRKKETIKCIRILYIYVILMVEMFSDDMLTICVKQRLGYKYMHYYFNDKNIWARCKGKSNEKE